MRTFDYARPQNLPAVGTLFQGGPNSEDPLHSPTQFLGGGTTLVDLMKLYVMRPETLVDIKQLQGLNTIGPNDGGLWLGALVTMAEAAQNEHLIRDYPMVVQSLAQAASTQIRNMARLGGNTLQRTRCSYFRDVSFSECNKRNPGSGCAALDGQNGSLAILGVSESCIANYPGDFAQTLVALDAIVSTTGAFNGRPFIQLHRFPGNSPEIETCLAPDELIIGFILPAPSEWTRRSIYIKIRDRDSYAFALASAAVGLALENDTVGKVRIALGGVASVPWRAEKAEAALLGRLLNEQTAIAAAEAEFASAVTHSFNRYKLDLGKATLVRALLAAQAMEL